MSASAPRPLGPVKTVVYSLLPLLALAALVEGAFRAREIFHPPLAVDYGLGFDEGSRVFRVGGLFRQDYVTRRDKRVSFPAERFARRKPGNEFRAFMIGGSNVNYLHHRFHDLERAIERDLAPGKRVELVNVGGLAYGSQRLLRVAHELMDYDPDLLLVYSGHNEFEELDQLQLVELDNPPVQRVVYVSAFMRYWRDRVAWRQIDALQHAHNQKILGNPQVDYMAAAMHVFTPDEVEDRMRRYEDHLDRIVALYREHGVAVIMGTVATNYWQPDLPPDRQEERDRVAALYAAGEHAAGLALARETLRAGPRHQASDAENEIIRRVAARHGVPLVDVEAAIAAAEPNGVPGETLFSDRCHVTEEGKAILLEAYRPRMVEAARAAFARRAGEG